MVAITRIYDQLSCFFLQFYWYRLTNNGKRVRSINNTSFQINSFHELLLLIQYILQDPKSILYVIVIQNNCCFFFKGRFGNMLNNSIRIGVDQHPLPFVIWTPSVSRPLLSEIYFTTTYCLYTWSHQQLNHADETPDNLSLQTWRPEIQVLYKVLAHCRSSIFDYVLCSP